MSDEVNAHFPVIAGSLLAVTFQVVRQEDFELEGSPLDRVRSFRILLLRPAWQHPRFPPNLPLVEEASVWILGGA